MKQRSVSLPATMEQDPEWVLIEEGFVLTREHEIESLFSVSNGYVGTRGSLFEGSALSEPATFVAGVFDAAPGSIPTLLRAPEWTRLSIIVNGSTLRLDSGRPLKHYRLLDMRQGILWRNWRHLDPHGRITHIRSLRLASLADRSLLLQSLIFTPENYSGYLTLEAPALSRVVAVQTASGQRVELVAQTHLLDSEGHCTSPPTDDSERNLERWTLEVDIGKTYRLDRMTRVRRSHPANTPRAATRIWQPPQNGIELSITAHCAAWRERWRASDLVIDGDPEAQRAVRFAMYHLISAANPEDEFVSIGARALTGPAYNGHVFWDTEIFMLPFFTLTYPEAARSLLMYRYHTLPAARARAKQLGYRGALFAWESADTGEDVTPASVVAPDGESIRILAGEQEHHISADVAYGIWSYVHASGDERFLVEYGAEILFETARFWASRAKREHDGRYHIRQVIGPDEYHESVDDNAYTNGMAQWNLEIAAQTAARLARHFPDPWHELSRRLNIDEEEPREWLQIAEHLHLGFDPWTGLFEQFEGYFGLEEIDLADYEPRNVPMDVLLGPERIRGSKVIKQADVVMLLYLLWDRFPSKVRESNFRYYEPRTGHGSSLSPPIHAAMAARLGDAELAERYFQETSEIDLENRLGNAAGGVHAAALGGLWQAVVFGFAGASLAETGPQLNPRLPKAWKRLQLNLQWRGRSFPIDLQQQSPDVRAVREMRP